ncbi:MAG: YesL family protein [Oliverpabstia sp.]
MDRLFNMDNKFFTVMGRVADLMMLNIVFIICCLPIVTIGASLTALHYVTLKMARNEESYIIRSFFKSFKQNFKQATVINLIMLLFGGLLYLDLNIINNIERQHGLWYCMYCLSAFGIVYFDDIPVSLSCTCQILQLPSSTHSECISDVDPSSSLYCIDGTDHCCTCCDLFIPTAQVQSMAVLLLFILMGFALEAFINGHFLVKIFDNYIIETPSKTSDTESNSSEQTPAV